MFVGILLRDFAGDFGLEFESSRHGEIFEISSRAVKQLLGATLRWLNSVITKRALVTSIES